jgi:hypothetical protein
VSDGEDGHESFEDRLRALAREVGRSVERIAGPLDRDELADRIDTGGERVRELADFAGRWLKAQSQDRDARSSAQADEGAPDSGRRRLRPAGPHPRDVPTEEQGLALSALDSGRWKVDPGSNVLIADGEGPDPSERIDLVGELRARDWINADGEVTLVGRSALKRWEEGPEA